MTIGFLAQEREHEKVPVAIYVGRGPKLNHGSYLRGCMLDFVTIHGQEHSGARVTGLTRDLSLGRGPS